MSTEIPDWTRLQKALAVEAEKGFTDLQGNQYRFSEFLCLSFGKTPDGLLPVERRKWQSIAAEFGRYDHKTVEDRQHLVADTRQFLDKLQQELQRREEEKTHPPQTPTVKSPRTTPLVAEKSKVNVNFNLDSPLSELSDIGYRRSGYLARLGLQTVRDILYYYPRDHIDYARQVNVQDLVAGETVTVVGTVKRCNCFSSPKNKKL
ncbi:MAG: DNA helicase RecG, partial [Coleofasciculus sp. C2-GNP5-27]